MSRGLFFQSFTFFTNSEKLKVSCLFQLNNETSLAHLVLGGSRRKYTQSAMTRGAIGGRKGFACLWLCLWLRNVYGCARQQWVLPITGTASTSTQSELLRV